MFEGFSTKFTDRPSVFLHSPRPLELSAIEECVAMDNIKILEHNGFKLSIDNEGATGRKLKLLTMPYSKNTIFGIKGNS